MLRALRDDGGTIILITHKLDEVMEISDTITVMRAGRTVGALPHGGHEPRGDRARDGRPRRRARGRCARGRARARMQRRRAAAPALEVRDLVVAGERRARAVDDVVVRGAPREILGIAGVEGNGQSELIEAIAGLRERRAARSASPGTDVTALSRARARRRAGSRTSPRIATAAASCSTTPSPTTSSSAASARTRAAACSIARASSRTRARRSRVATSVPPIRCCPRARCPAATSRRSCRARARATHFVLLAAQPTRGVDVGAIELIHARLRAARDAGTGDPARLAPSSRRSSRSSDRVAVMYGGRIVAIVPRAEASEAIARAAHDRRNARERSRPRAVRCSLA